MVPLIVDGLGIGLILGPLTGIVISAVEPRHEGAASGMLNAGIQVSVPCGVPILGIVFYNAIGNSLTASSIQTGFQDVLPWLFGVAAVELWADILRHNATAIAGVLSAVSDNLNTYVQSLRDLAADNDQDAAVLRVLLETGDLGRSQLLNR